MNKASLLREHSFTARLPMRHRSIDYNCQSEINSASALFQLRAYDPQSACLRQGSEYSSDDQSNRKASGLASAVPCPRKPLKFSNPVSPLLAQFAGRLEHTVKMPEGESFFGFARRSLLELTNIKFALASFVVNNLRRRYRRSVLGFAWSLLNPLLMMCVMTFVFSMLLSRVQKSSASMSSPGFCPGVSFCESVLNGSGAITGAESFLKKSIFRKCFFPQCQFRLREPISFSV